MESWPYKIKPGETIQTEAARISLNREGILVVRYRSNLDFTLDKAEALNAACEMAVAGNKVPVLICTGEFGEMPAETREFLSGDVPARHRRAVALVINNLPHRLMARFIMLIRRKKYPTATFENEREAQKWLAKYI